MRSYAMRILSAHEWRKSDLIWVEKELFPFVPAFVEILLLMRKRVILDLDDAIFHNYDCSANRFVRYFYGRKIDHLMARANLVVAGNEYIANRARSAGAAWVVVMPTVLDLTRYHIIASTLPTKPTHARRPPIRIGWVGTPATVRYLETIREPLSRLAQEVDFRLVILGGGFMTLPGVAVVCLRWTEETESESIASFDIGVMPLVDDDWERGKCGYKLIQYMACGIPTVASPVGVNCEIVRHGENGFLAQTADEWVTSLRKLIYDAELRRSMGAIGRKLVQEKYSLQFAGKKMHDLFRQVVES